VQKILTEILPPSSGVSTSKDFRDALVDCCVEFITLIASEANEISEREAKKTIACEHVTAALRELGFPAYVGPVQESADEYKKQQAVGGIMTTREGVRHLRCAVARKEAEQDGAERSQSGRAVEATTGAFPQRY